MKCNKCDHVWDLFKEDDHSCCPKCQNKFVPKYQNFDSLSEGLGYCLKVGGKELFQNRSKLNSYISDLIGNTFPDRNLIKNAVESDIGSILLEADEKNPQEQQNAITRAVNRMVSEFSTDSKKAEEIVLYFATALRWKLPSASSASKENKSAEMQAVQKEKSANTSPNTSAVISSSSDRGTKHDATQPKTKSNIDNEYEKLAALTLTEKNREIIPTVKGMVVTDNATVVKKKRSPLPWILLFMLLIGTVGGWYYWSALQNQQSLGLATPVPTEPPEAATTEVIIAEMPTDNLIAEVITETIAASLRKKLCKKSVNCGIIRITQEADFLWEDEKENR